MEAENNSNEDEEVIDQITIAANAGASLSAPESEKFRSTKGRTSKTANVSTWDRLKEFPKQNCHGKREAYRCNACKIDCKINYFSKN
jgi:hypothetical protein